MLEKNRWLRPHRLRQFARYPVDCEYIAILSDNTMLFEGITCVFAYLSKVAIGVTCVSIYAVVAVDIVLEPAAIGAIEAA